MASEAEYTEIAADLSRRALTQIPDWDIECSLPPGLDQPQRLAATAAVRARIDALSAVLPAGDES
jgi:hypothetical protein